MLEQIKSFEPGRRDAPLSSISWNGLEGFFGSGTPSRIQYESVTDHIRAGLSRRSKKGLTRALRRTVASVFSAPGNKGSTAAKD